MTRIHNKKRSCGLKTSFIALLLCFFCGPTLTWASKISELPPLIHGGMERERFTVVENGRVIGGINTEVINELSKRMGFSAVHRKCPFKRCLVQLTRRELDAMMFIVTNPERSRFLHYIQVLPNPLDIHFFMTPDSVDRLKRYDDLLNLRLGTIKGFYYSQQLDEDARLYRQEVLTEQQLPKMLIAGRIDAFPVYGVSHTHISSSYPQLRLAPYSMASRDFAFIVIAKNSPYAPFIDEIHHVVIDMIRDGTLDAIWEKYHPGQLMPVPDHFREE